ncbi:MAG: hypothetical protein ABI887_20790 [Burkholderiales bacterium]
MTNEQLIGKYGRLRGELEAAYAVQAWHLGRAGRIDRITSDLAEIERTLAVQRVGARLISFDDLPVQRSNATALSMA